MYGRRSSSIELSRIHSTFQEVKMTSSQLFRISGLLLLLGAIAFIVHLVARSAITAGSDPVIVAQDSLWGPINILGVLGAALVLLGLPAMYSRMAGPSGLGGLVGVALVALAWMFFGIFLSLYSLLVMPWLASEAPALIAASASLPSGIIVAFIAGLVVEFIGTILLALPFIRERIKPSWVGYLLLAAALVKVIGNFIAPSGPASNFVVNLLSNLGPILFLIAVGYLGYDMWLEYAPDKQVESRVRPSRA
jgi:hypothetical protein